MAQTSLFKTFVRYVSSNVLGMMGFSLYILIDTFFISSALGADGLTALNLAIPAYNLMNGCALMLAVGGATIYAIAKGQKDEKKGNEAFTNTIRMGILASLLFFLIGFLFSEELARLLGADAQVFSMTNTYLKVLLMYSPFFIMEQIFICFTRNDEAPRLAMAATLTGSCTNILLDYIFMFPLGMGMFGAVFATGLSALMGTSVVLLHIVRKKNQFHFRKCPLSPGKWTGILKLGASSLITEMSSGIVIIVFNFLILGLEGNTGVAANGVIANISLVVIALYTGIGNGIQPLISHSYGEGKQASIRVLLRYALITMAGLTVILYAIIFLLADPIAGMFNSQQNSLLQELAVSGLRLYFTGIPFAGFNIILSVFFSSVDRPLPAQIISLARGFFIIIPVAFLLSLMLKMTGVWLAFPVAEGITVIISVFRWLRD